ncbi:MAG: glutamate--tRNA ligase [Chthonomonas sp.]|nr:glutamate--tRNA ligase [Chthonomonas sp.]
MSVRVRYAPSPTGSPHVGNIRDALFKHLFAKHHKGTHVLRIEDTDRTRFVPGVEDEIVESLRWMGIEWQEGLYAGGDFVPYRQSERKELGIYEREIQRLIELGHAYPAFDSPEELTEMREFQQINKQPIGYFGGQWRDATPAQVEAAEAAGKPKVIRQRIPRNTTIVIEDAIRGRVEFDSNTVDDPVLIKGDGMPTYHFAAMVDDHLMEITHIMRGEEWISSAPKHAALFDSFGWERPIFVHCPVINGPDGKKLSKRHGDTKCLDFRSAGYLPAALANFIALIGWAPGDNRELMSMDELAEAFDLGGLQPAPGVFDMSKLNWMNANYIRAVEPTELVTKVRDFAAAPTTQEYWSRDANLEGGVGRSLDALVACADEPLVAQAIQLEQERVNTLADFGPACEFFVRDEVEFDEAAKAKAFAHEHVGALFAALGEFLAGKELVSAEACHDFVTGWAKEHGIEKIGPVVQPIRVALTGKLAGPGLYELMSALGPARMLARFSRAIK